MVIGIFLKNYKVYSGLKFIPLANGTYFSAIFGPNGVGKSTILEALDTFFNDREWNINKSSTGYMNTPFIVPVFLINKIELKRTGRANTEYYKLVSKISDYIWNLETLHGSNIEITTFIKFKNELKDQINTNNYFILPLGIMRNSKTPYFGSFQRDETFLQIFNIEKQQIENQTERTKAEDDAINEYFQNDSSFLSYIKDNYYYAYIPTETNISEYTKIETRNMQMFMHKDINDEIARAISEEKLGSINQKLIEFVESISEKLKFYTYKKPTRGKNSITMSDLINTIITAFFSIRVLTSKTENISIDQMSSGEKRKALIDVAFAFLDGKNQQTKKIILAIDEPELSLHISACYEQFEKLKKISQNEHQIIITTHWYGFLPIIYDGLGVNITKNNEKRDSRIQYYDLSKYQEEIKIAQKSQILPYDIKLKGRYDLVQSVISSLTSEEPYNYIFVEGSSDKIYLDYYFEDKISKSNLRIIPVGGNKEVINILKIINLAVMEDKGKFKGRVLGIIDTDEQIIKIDSFKESDNVKLKRIQYDRGKNNIGLINIDSNLVTPPTDIEDTLEPNIFIDVLKEFIDEADGEYKFIYTKEINKNAKCSYNVIDYTESEREKIRNFFKIDNNKRKVDFAKKYIESKVNFSKLSFVEEINKIMEI